MVSFWKWLTKPSGRDSRGLFYFWNGRKWVGADGLQSLRMFLSLPDFDWDETPIMLNGMGVATQLQGSKIIADAVRSVFGLKYASEGGLSEAECLSVFEDFRIFCDHVKKNGNLFPTTQDSIERISQTVEKPSSDSGSTGSVPLPVPPLLLVEPTH